MAHALFKSYIKGILQNRGLWLWGIVFMLFWIVVGAFELSQNIPNTLEAQTLTTSSWFGLISMFSLSSIAISIAYTVFHASSSLAYSFKYTKLTPKQYIATLVGSSSIVGLTLSALTLAVTYALFSIHFNASIAPSNPLGAIAVAALAGVFVMAFAVMLVLIAVNYVGLRSVTLLTFIPMMLAFALGDTQMYSTMPVEVIYASPYNSISSLLYAAYSGQNVYAQFYNAQTPMLQWPIMLASIVIWIVVLVAVDAYLLRKIKPKKAEEGRQI
jgi:hypothetical protein